MAVADDSGEDEISPDLLRVEVVFRFSGNAKAFVEDAAEDADATAAPDAADLVDDAAADSEAELSDAAR